LIFTAGLTLLTTLIFGMAPAWKTSRVDLLSALKTQGVATGRGKSRLRNMLSIVEIALCLPLLVGTGLFVRSMQRVLSTNLGYDPKNLMAQHFDLISWHYSNLRSALFFQDLLDRVREMPGVVSASVIRSSFGTPSVLIEGVEKRASQITWVNVVDRQYFETMRIPIVQGRGLTESDVRGAAKVAIINGAMARLFWPGQNPIGQRIAVPPAVDESNPVEIVGVAGSIREFGPQGKTHSQIYLPQRQFDQSQIPESADINGDLIIRTTGLTTGIAASLRGAIQTIAPGLPFQTLKTAEAETWSSMAIQRFGATLLGLLGLLGVVLATVGIYGLIAYSVCQRTNEIGIRMAMGADREQILRLFLHDGAALILCGVGFGVGAAILTVRLLTNFLFDVKPHDFATFLGVGILLAGVAFVASYLSARRATQLDPVSALREE
jgi:predicted permease